MHERKFQYTEYDCAHLLSLFYRTTGDIVPILVSKCLGGRPKIRERTSDILLMYIEIDQNIEIEEELVKGLENKQPKIVQACLELLRRALSYVTSFTRNIH